MSDLNSKLQALSLRQISERLNVGENPTTRRPLRTGAILNMITRVVGEKLETASAEDAAYARQVLATLPITAEDKAALGIGLHTALSPRTPSGPRTHTDSPTQALTHGRRETDITNPDRSPQGRPIGKAHLVASQIGTPISSVRPAPQGPVVAGGIQLRLRPAPEIRLLDFDASSSDSDSIASDDSDETYGARADVHEAYAPYTNDPEGRPIGLPEHDTHFTGSVRFSYPDRHIRTPKPTFNITVKEGVATKVKATNIRHKPDALSHRGKTELHPELGVMEDTSHLVADEYMGSGYKSSYNTIPTSQTFNRKVQAGVEQAIEGIVENKTFNLDIGIEYYSHPLTTADKDELWESAKESLPDGTVDTDDIAFLKYDSPDGKQKLKASECTAIMDILKQQRVINSDGKFINSGKLTDKQLKSRIQAALPSTVASKVGFTEKIIKQLQKCAHKTTKDEYLTEIARTNKQHRVKSMTYNVFVNGKSYVKSTGPDAVRGVSEKMLRRVTHVPNRSGTGTHPLQIGPIKQAAFREVPIYG